MPIYVGDAQLTREDLKQLAKKNVCKECQCRLDIFTEFGKDVYFLACSDWPRTHHEGIEREASQYEQKGIEALNIATRREIVEQEIGATKTRALDKYIGVVSLTKPQAKEILVSVYPGAPEGEIARAVLLCASYGLNPLMKHVFLIKFNQWNKGHTQIIGEDWVTVIGIKAKRLLGSRRGTFSYVDGTPRVMTEQEQRATFGEVYGDKISVIVKLKDPVTGAEVVGYGHWPREKEPMGTDKGNTKFNMASIRGESQALDRLRPGEMPVGIEAMPEEVADAAIEGSFTVTEDKETSTDDASKEHWCPIHNVSFIKKGKMKWWAHKIEGTDKWCPEKQAKKQVQQAEVEPEQVEEEEPVPVPSELFIDLDWLDEKTEELKWKMPALKSFLSYKYKIDTEGLITDVLSRLSREQQEELTKEIQDRLEMS